MTQESRDLAEYQTDHDLLIRVDQKVSDLVAKFEARDKVYVTQDEFWPVKVLVYGCTGIMLTSVVGALLFLILQHH
jgi:hypothetical protein